MKAGEVTLMRDNPDTLREAQLCPWDDGSAYRFAVLGAIMAVMPKPPASVLECGCWNGWLCHALARRGYDVTGLDACDDALGIAWNSSPFGGANRISLICEDYESHLGGDDYNAIIFNASFHHSEKPFRTLQLVYDALKLGGICVLVEPGLGHSWSPFTRNWAKTWNVTEKDTPPIKLWWLGRKIGFRKVKVYPQPETLFRLAFTCGFSVRPSLKLLTKCASPLLGFTLFAGKWLHGMIVLTK